MKYFFTILLIVYRSSFPPLPFWVIRDSVCMDLFLYFNLSSHLFDFTNIENTLLDDAYYHFIGFFPASFSFWSKAALFFLATAGWTK